MKPRDAHSLRAVVAVAVLAVLLPAALHAQEADSTAPAPERRASLFEGNVLAGQIGSGFAKGFDAVLLRPMGALKTGVGLALFSAAALMSCGEGWDVMEEGWELLVAEPAKSTFQRPLGDF